MRQSLRRLGSHGRGWWQKFEREGQAGFQRARPTPFDFSTPASRSRCFFDMSIGSEPLGRVEFELADEVLPVTCLNFRKLCEGAYKGSEISHILKHVMMGGGVAGESRSAFETRYFADEAFLIPHAQPGLLSMANSGVDTNGSVFYVTLLPAPHLDGRCVAFGRVADGFDTLLKIQGTVFTQRGRPTQPVRIADCGVLATAASS